MKLDNKTKWLIVVFSFLTPVVINILMAIPSFGLAVLDNDQWLGFFGNYSGGIIGGFVAYLIASGQIKAQIDENKQSEIESNRSYIILEEFIAPVNLENIMTHPNSKILSNPFYEKIKKDLLSRGASIPFYKIHHSGQPDIILDCHIKMIFIGEANGQLDNESYVVESHLSVFEKNTEIFIPIANIKYQYTYPKKINLTYQTIKGETIKYTYNVEEMTETHTLIKKSVKQPKKPNNVLYHVDLKGVEWVYPVKFNKPPEPQAHNTNNNLSISMFGPKLP